MTDIVKRLRERNIGYDRQAADEIERLRSQLAGLIEKLAGFIEKGMDDLTMVAAFQVNEELPDEIKRLRSVLGELLEWFDGCDPRTSARAVEKARHALEHKP